MSDVIILRIRITIHYYQPTLNHPTIDSSSIHELMKLQQYIKRGESKIVMISLHFKDLKTLRNALKQSKILSMNIKIIIFTGIK